MSGAALTRSDCPVDEQSGCLMPSVGLDGDERLVPALHVALASVALIVLSVTALLLG